MEITIEGEIFLLDISSIQPSQFYISESKLEKIGNWAAFGSIKIPVVLINGLYAATDGHTRLKWAQMAGYTNVQVYIDIDDLSNYIPHFVNEARKRGIYNVADMPIISEADYAEKWHKYCSDFFDNANKKL